MGIQVGQLQWRGEISFIGFICVLVTFLLFGTTYGLFWLNVQGTVEKLRYQELEAIGHNALLSGTQRVMNAGAQLDLPLSCSTGNGAAHF